MMEFADIIFYLDLFFWEICFEIGIIHKQIIEHIYICYLLRYLSRYVVVVKKSLKNSLITLNTTF